MIDPVDRVGPGGLVGEVRPGGLAELCAVPTHHLVRLPAEVSFEDAACLPVAYGTAIRMMYTIGQIQRERPHRWSSAHRAGSALPPCSFRSSPAPR